MRHCLTRPFGERYLNPISKRQGVQRQDALITGAGMLLIVASAILLLAEIGPDFAIPVEFAVGPIIAGACLAVMIRNTRRLRPI